MASNYFGTLFRMTTWGESHGKAVGVVIDGCPAGIAFTEDDIQAALRWRSPGNSPFTSPRKEPDHAEIYSGVFAGKTTGAPISIIIPNQDVNSTHYESIKDIMRPGHANATYEAKYGVTDYRGGGRASARETVCRVAAGALAKKILQLFSVEVCAYLSSLGNLSIPTASQGIADLKLATQNSPIFCPDPDIAAQMVEKLQRIQAEGDSIGGAVTFVATGKILGLGDPVYEKIEANLAKAMLSIPASKGFELGAGFDAIAMSGSTHNDLFLPSNMGIQTQTNHAGGTLGGIATGMPLFGRVAFKPTSSIQKPQVSIDRVGQPTLLQIPPGSRHDPCVAIRAVPVVEAMCALVLVDALLMHRATSMMSAESH